MILNGSDIGIHRVRSSSVILNGSDIGIHRVCGNDTYTDKWFPVEFNVAGEPRMVKNISLKEVEAPL